MTPLVFLSHSATDPLTKALRTQLAEALRKAGLETFVDVENIFAGDHWRREIYSAIWRAHAAVVLFSTAALESDWVRFEATILSSRLWGESGFLLLPVTVPPVQASILAEKPFEPLNLAEVQAVNATEPLSESLTRIVDFFRPLLERLRSTPVDLMVDAIAAWLPAEPHLLETAANSLQIPGGPSPRLRHEVAGAFITRPIELVYEALGKLAHRMSRESLQKIAFIVTPFWVDPEAAATLAIEALAIGRSKAVLLNAHRESTAISYARRASGRYPFLWLVITVTAATGEDAVGGLEAEIRTGYTSIAIAFKGAPPLEIDHAIQAEREAVIVVLPKSVSKATLHAIRARFPTCTFLQLTEDRVPPQEELLEMDAVFLSPPLTVEHERLMLVYQGKLMRIADGMGA